VIDLELTYIDKVTCHTSGGGHRGADQMRSSTRALASLEISIGRRGASFTGLKTIGIHRQAHRATGLAPFKTCITKDFV
jgi:hypothetical protein